MTFNWWTFLFQALNFVVLAYILHRLLYRPLHEAIDRRRQTNAEAQATALHAQKEAESLQQQLRDQLADMERRRQDMIHAAREQAEGDCRKLLAEGERVLQRRRDEALQALERERTEALEALRGEVVDQAVALTRRLLGEAADRTLNQQLALHLADALRHLPEAQRHPLQAQWQPDDGALLEVAQELDSATVTELTEAVAAAVGRRVELSVQIRPALLGGARLRLAGHVWDGSLAGQLDDVAGPRHNDGEAHAMIKHAEHLAQHLHACLDAVRWQVRHREVGWVNRVGDGVAYLLGVPSVRYGELLRRDDGLTALAFDLRPAEVGVLFLDPSEHVSAGDEMRATGSVASVPVGDELLGRVVDALGRPLDGEPPPRCSACWAVEREAPGVVERQPVREPLHTGIKVLDSLLPLGRGQRELILGDRATGKTAIALDAILAQRGSGVRCVYAAIGQRKASITGVVETLQEQGALGHTVVVAADADAPPGQQYLAPYAACTVGEYFMHQGHDVLVVYDDLTRHADAYRRLCLLLGRPPAREAYPADVFYLHARLLERATRLHDRLGGGSLTALPIATTQAGQISAYIPTNLISITDGQIYLDTRLFNEGLRPAVDVGLSVSRVGGKAQPPVLRKLASDLRLLYAQLRELETFARFGAELEPATRQRLERGCRLREALKQPRLRPLRMALECVTLFAVREGYLDPVPIEEVGPFLDALGQRLEEVDPFVLDALEGEEGLSEAVQARLRQAIEAVRGQFLHGESHVAGTDAAALPGRPHHS
jgi:F-type H+-transporting ATPase subunit alpha